MSKSIQSLIDSGTKLWLDSIDPDLVISNKEMGATGATSNPIIIADLIKTGRFDDLLKKWDTPEKSDEQIAWLMTDHLVSQAQSQFEDIYQESGGNDGYVSFEVDPLIEDVQLNLPHEERVRRYVELGKKWSEGHTNRMIKVPATPAGLESVEELAAAGIPLNVTLIFSDRQYQAARDAVWKGAKRRGDLPSFKSVYSIFVSRIDVYTLKQNPNLLAEAQGQVAIVNAKRIWQKNQEFWKQNDTPLDQEIVFASTGTKRPEETPWRYVEALCGSDVQTNPPSTNQKAAQSGVTFSRQVDQYPNSEILAAIDAEVDFDHMEKTLMEEGLAKFADPHKALIELIGSKRS